MEDVFLVSRTSVGTEPTEFGVWCSGSVRSVWRTEVKYSIRYSMRFVSQRRVQGLFIIGALSDLDL